MWMQSSRFWRPTGGVVGLFTYSENAFNPYWLNKVHTSIFLPELASWEFWSCSGCNWHRETPLQHLCHMCRAVFKLPIDLGRVIQVFCPSCKVPLKPVSCSCAEPSKSVPLGKLKTLHFITGPWWITVPEMKYISIIIFFNWNACKNCNGFETDLYWMCSFLSQVICEDLRIGIDQTCTNQAQGFWFCSVWVLISPQISCCIAKLDLKKLKIECLYNCMYLCEECIAWDCPFYFHWTWSYFSPSETW